MAHSLCFAPICSLKSSNRPGTFNFLCECAFSCFAGCCSVYVIECDFVLLEIGVVTGNSVVRKAFPITEACQNAKARKFQSLEVKVRLNSVSHL